MLHFPHAFKTKLQDLKRDQERIWLTLGEMAPDPSGDPDDDGVFKAFDEGVHAADMAVEAFEVVLGAVGAEMVFYEPDANNATAVADKSPAIESEDA